MFKKVRAIECTSQNRHCIRIVNSIIEIISELFSSPRKAYVIGVLHKIVFSRHGSLSRVQIAVGPLFMNLICIPWRSPDLGQVFVPTALSLLFERRTKLGRAWRIRRNYFWWNSSAGACNAMFLWQAFCRYQNTASKNEHSVRATRLAPGKSLFAESALPGLNK